MHNIDFLHDLAPNIIATIRELVIGVIAGLLVVGFVTLVKKVIRNISRTSQS